MVQFSKVNRPVLIQCKSALSLICLHAQSHWMLLHNSKVITIQSSKFLACQIAYASLSQKDSWDADLSAGLEVRQGNSSHDWHGMQSDSQYFCLARPASMHQQLTILPALFVYLLLLVCLCCVGKIVDNFSQTDFIKYRLKTESGTDIRY